MNNKANIKNHMYDVVSLDQYQENPNQFLQNHIAIKEGDYLYPVLSPTQEGPGVRVGSMMSLFEQPTSDSQKRLYSKENMIDFSDVNNMATMIDKLDAVKKLESDVLTSVDNIFTAKINPSDTPEMVALKTAVNSKHIDLDKYAYRLGANYNNDKRLFNKPNISLGMLKRMATALDMQVTLTIKDVPEAPNPIGHEIVVDITSNSSDEDE